MLLSTIVLATALAASACGGGGDDAPPAAFPQATVRQLDAAVDERIAADRLPGVAVLIIVPGEGEYVAARGAGDLATGAPREIGAPFRIASITKTFTATALLQLVDQGRLALSDKLSKWYPDFPRADAITIDDLLRMRSGIADSADQAFLAEYYANPLAPLGADEMVRRAAARGAEFEPAGLRTDYRNINFILLERIVTKVTGRPFAEHVRDAVLAPLGMRSTVYATDATFASPLRGYSLEAASGRFVDKTALDPSPAGGAGAIVSTAADLARYVRALCTGRLLDPATQAARLRAERLEGAPEFVGYGQGVIRFGRFCGHNGTIFGFSSEAWYLPEKDAVLVINVNRLDADDESRSTGLFVQLTRILFPGSVQW